MTLLGRIFTLVLISLPAFSAMKVSTYSNPAGSRRYFLFTPSQYDGKTPLPLMIMLHGCTQNPEGFAADTGMNDLAEKKGFAVVYPEETSQYNAMSCWNWFTSENLQRGSGEISIIVGMIDDLQFPVDRKHIYLTGFSAGAALAANLAACYGDVFAGVAIHSGLEYDAAINQNEAFMAMSQGSSRPADQNGKSAAACSAGHSHGPVPTIIFQGKTDYTVNSVNATHLVVATSKMNDILDDNSENNTQSAKALQTVRSSAPNGGHTYAVSTYGQSVQGPLITMVLIDGMSHAWSGAARMGSYADPKGPNATEMIWNFVSPFARQ